MRFYVVTASGPDCRTYRAYFTTDDAGYAAALDTASWLLGRFREMGYDSVRVTEEGADRVEGWSFVRELDYVGGLL